MDKDTGGDSVNIRWVYVRNVMREELAELHKQSDQIRNTCHLQRKALASQRSFLKLQQEKLQYEIERLKLLDATVPNH